MAKNPAIISTDLEKHFQALRHGEDAPGVVWDDSSNTLPSSSYAPSAVANTRHGLYKAAGSGIVYGQPQFFSPVHTPINWQYLQNARKSTSGSGSTMRMKPR